ncbi:Uncharacterised protein [Salmonella enterica subsp. enterica serovar Bovismorbificans]|nr:Uncharacterised protein [Salmonella enterica subsp. enterica serovar Bovismorbificans]
MAMESTPVSSSCSVKSSQVCSVCAGLVVYERVPWACAPWLRTACNAAFILRGSFMASKTRKTSMPFLTARSTKRSTTSSA